MNSPSKGTVGYIKASKRKKLLISLLFIAIVLSIFFTGYIIYGTRTTVFSVFAALASLPAAKFIVSYIIIFPFKSINKGLLDESKYSSLAVAYELILSSSKELTFINEFIVINGNILIYFPERKKIFDTKKYLETSILTSTDYTSINFFETIEDYVKQADKLIKEYSVSNDNDYHIKDTILPFCV